MPLDFGFMCFFLVEMLFKMVGYGWWPYWADPWDRLDGFSAVLTVSAYMFLSILPYLLAAAGSAHPLHVQPAHSLNAASSRTSRKRGALRRATERRPLVPLAQVRL